MWRGETDLSDAELTSLGFRIVAGHDFLFRPNILKNEYNAVDDNRDVFDLDIPADIGAYVEIEWDRTDDDG